MSNVAMASFLRESICQTSRKEVVINRLCYLWHIHVTPISLASVCLQTTAESPIIASHIPAAAQVKALACGAELYRGSMVSQRCWFLTVPAIWLSFICHNRHTPSTHQMGRLEQQGCFCTFLHDMGSTLAYECSFSIVITVA